MTTYRSTGLVDFVASKGSVKDALANGRILLFGTTQPTSADTGSGGIAPLVTLNLYGGIYVAETKPQWKFTISGGSGSITSIKIGGIEQLSSPITFVDTLNNLATAVAANISGADSPLDCTATASSASVTITGPINSGAALNTLSVVVTTSGALSVAYNDGGGTGAVFTTGVASAYGCNWDYAPTDGVLAKEATNWYGEGTAAGNANWFMIVTDSDTGLTSSTIARRLIGSVGTAGADLNLSSRVIAIGAPVIITEWNLSVKKAI